MRPIEEQIGKSLAKEDGGQFGFVCIYRRKGDPLDDGSDHARRTTVGEFLQRKENQCGLWLIDGGWGGPPGAIHVRWNEHLQEWEYGGYCGRCFADYKEVCPTCGRSLEPVEEKVFVPSKEIEPKCPVCGHTKTELYIDGNVFAMQCSFCGELGPAGVSAEEADQKWRRYAGSGHTVGRSEVV